MNKQNAVRKQIKSIDVHEEMNKQNAVRKQIKSIDVHEEMNKQNAVRKCIILVSVIKCTVIIHIYSYLQFTTIS